MTNLIQEFIEWLRKEGCEFIRDGERTVVTQHGQRLFSLTDDYDEEQPELLLWALKELERRDIHWGLQPLGPNYICLTRSPGNEPYTRHEAKTMTAAALSGLVRR